MRLIAAMLVIMTHSFVLTGDGVKKDAFYNLTNGDLPLSLLGLRTFFVISGYLICQSMEYSKSYASYLAKRVLRIFPGFIVCIVLTVFVVGAIFTGLSLPAYFSNTETWAYFINISLYKYKLFLPGVFQTHPAHEVNGSIWTLAYEFSYYIMILCGAAVGLFRRKWLAVIGFFIFFGLQLYVIYGHVPPKIQYFLPYTDLDIKNFTDFGLYFTAGALFYLYRDQVTYTYSLAVLAVVIYSLAIYFNVAWLARYIALPYLILYIAFVPKIGWITAWGEGGDYSYGMYIYGMPVQQMILSVWGKSMNPNVLSLLSVFFLFPIAWLSWNLVESKFLKLKKYFDVKSRTLTLAV